MNVKMSAPKTLTITKNWDESSLGATEDIDRIRVVVQSATWKFDLDMENQFSGTGIVNTECGDVNEAVQVSKKATGEGKYISLLVNEVSYSGSKMHTLRNDQDTKDFSAPHWKDANNDGDATDSDQGDMKKPISFTRDTKMEVSAKFVTEGPVGGNVKIRGDIEGGLKGSVDHAIPEQSASLTSSGNKKTISIGEIKAKKPFKDEVQFLDQLVIDWEVSADGGESWCDVSNKSKNKAYILWDDPTLSKKTWTVIHVGTKAADGVTGTVGTDDQKVLNKIWNRLDSSVSSGSHIKRASDGKILTYYGYRDENGNQTWDPGVDTDFNSPSKCRNTTTISLIKNRNGQCGAWANFMKDLLKAHGLNDVNGSPVGFVRIDTRDLGFAVKNWEKGSSVDPNRKIIHFDAGVDGSGAIEPGLDEAADAKGVEGQGTSPNPPSNFSNHFILSINGTFYDPSYGLKESSGDPKKYEIQAFDGTIFRNSAGELILRDAPPDNGTKTDTSDQITTFSP